jgi:hypothetical protein
MANRADATTSVSANGASGRSSKKIPWAHYLGLRKNMEPSYRNDLKLFIYLYFYGVCDFFYPVILVSSGQMLAIIISGAAAPIIQTKINYEDTLEALKQ